MYVSISGFLNERELKYQEHVHQHFRVDHRLFGTVASISLQEVFPETPTPKFFEQITTKNIAKSILYSNVNAHLSIN